MTLYVKILRFGLFFYKLPLFLENVIAQGVLNPAGTIETESLRDSLQQDTQQGSAMDHPATKSSLGNRKQPCICHPSV